MMKLKNQKLEITYPCCWLYKLIAMNDDALKSAVKEIITDSDYSLLQSKSSRTGKYLSYNLEIEVHSEEVRNFFFSSLKQHPSIKMVL